MPQSVLPNVDDKGRRNIKLAPKDSCLILRPTKEGFQVIVYHNYPPDMEEEDIAFYHILCRGLADIVVEDTESVMTQGMHAMGQPTEGTRPVDSEGNIISTGTAEPLDRNSDLTKIVPRGRA